MKLIKPSRLQSGDTVAIVSLSWGGPATFPARYEAGKRQLVEAFNVNVIEMPSALKPADWLSKNPEARAADLMAAFADPNINGIICSIGGDDSINLLPYMDFNTITSNPKIFMGYSDSTVSHFACMKAGLTSFYGPSIMAGFGENAGLFPYMESSVRKNLFEDKPAGLIETAAEWTDEMLDWSVPSNQSQKRKTNVATGQKILQGTGTATGHLIGGCIDVLPMIVGTALWPDKESFKGSILFLETSEEAPPVHLVKRILRNLGAQDILSDLNGIILGRPGGQVPLEALTQYDTALQDVIRDEFNLPNLPLMTQLDFGHTSPMFVLPYGVQAEIDCTKQTFSVLESGVK